MRKVVFSLLGLFLLFAFSITPKATHAYTDYSYYRIETGGFLGEKNVKSALASLKAETGWWATYQHTGDFKRYYQVYSGGFKGEEFVKQIVHQFQDKTNLEATYKPLGSPTPYQQVLAGKFYGEQNTKNILQEFTAETGILATYEPTGTGVSKKKIQSGAFLGEDTVKTVLQQFQKATGISATYHPTGTAQNYSRIVSGGFAGEDYVKLVMEDFVSQTGISASYEPTKYTEYYTVKTGGFYGEENVIDYVGMLEKELDVSVSYEPGNKENLYHITFEPLTGDTLKKVTSHLDTQNWWYSKRSTGEKIATTFRIISEPSLDSNLLNKGLSYFKNKNWWATISKTGEKAYNKFYIMSEALADSKTLNKGLDFFRNQGMWVTTKTSDEKTYVYFNLITEPLLEKADINKVKDFFNEKGWWHKTMLTGEVVQTSFQIVAESLVGENQRDQALDFFKNQDWWAASKLTGEEGFYKIVTGGFQGQDNAAANAEMVTDKFGWWTKTVKIENGPQVTSTNYNLTLDQMIALQMKLTIPPQTDKYKNEPAYIYSVYVDDVNNKINLNGVHVRTGPGTNYDIVAKLGRDFKDFKILGKQGDWTKVSLTWKNAKYEDVLYHLNPANFPKGSKEYYQFLVLSKPAGINIDEVNEKILNDKAGILKGKAAAFAQAAKLYHINELYLIAHALHETGNGSSVLANGVTYNGKKVYNMFGYGAYDGSAIDSGAKRAYDEGWFTPELAIVGGARLIGSGYIFNETFAQDTLYKMRWNPVTPYHQYATDIGWATKQVKNLYNYYQMLDHYTLYIDLPIYYK